MNYSQVFCNSIQASRLILGCMRIADKPLKQITDLLDTAIECGINFFDHADIYGGGRSEEIFAQAIKECGISRDSIILQTKCGIRPGAYDLSKKHIISSAEQSLRRLNTDHVDVFLLHRPDTLMECHEIAEAFNELHDSCKVKYFGVSNFNSAQIGLLQQSCGHKLVIDQLQFGPAHTGLIDSGIHTNMTWKQAVDNDGHTLEYCRKNKITIQAWSPLQYGYFKGCILDPNSPYTALKQELDKLAKQKQIEPTAIIAAWILRHPATMQMISGTTQAPHLRSLARGCNISLSRHEWYKIYTAAGNTLP